MLYYKLREADIIILGSTVYWANLSGIMKNFFEYHMRYVIFKPPNAQNFYQLSKLHKIKIMFRLMKEFGPNDPRFKEKRYILITAATVTFKRIMGEISPHYQCNEKVCEET